MRSIVTKLVIYLLAVALPPSAARVALADDVDDATGRLIALDQRVHIMALEFNEAPRDAGDIPVRRLVEAQGLMQLGRAEEATTLLLDVAARWPATTAGRDATFLLADALFQIGDLRLARGYYEEALAKFSGSQRERRALIRLVDIAISTGELGQVDRYLAMLARTQGVALDPAVRYLEAKVLYQRGDLDGANRKFVSIVGSVPPASVYAWRARYFAATIRVKQGDLDGAARGYESLLGSKPADDVTREIQDLSRLALARINYRQGAYERAAASYRSVPPDSKWRPEALFELGWTHVAGKAFDGARATFAELLRAQPDGPRAPELKVLLANLDLRLGRVAEARTAFASVRDELEPTHVRLRDVIVRSQADPALLDSLTSRGHDQLDLAAFVPASARKWVRADAEVERLLRVANDVNVSQRMFADAGDAIERIETVLADSARQDPLELFLDLRRIRQVSGLLSIELGELRDRFTDRARRLETPHLQQAEARRLQQIDAERARVNAPRSPSVARERPDSVGFLRALVLRLEGPRSDVKFGLAEAMRSDNTASMSGARERAVAEQLQRLSEEEHQLHDDVLQRLNASDRKRLDRELQVASRADAVMSQLFALDARLHAEAEARLSQLQRLLADRQRDMAVTSGKMAAVVRDTQNLGDFLVRVMYTRVADRLYDLLVRADVGLIDVAWAVKDRSVRGLNVVLNKKKAEKDVIDREFVRQNQALDRRLKRAMQVFGELAADPAYSGAPRPAH